MLSVMADHLNPNQFRYPQSMQDDSVVSGIRDTFQTAHKLYGSNDLRKAFPTDVGSTIAPWPTAGRQKGKPLYDQGKVTDALRQPPKLDEFDPRNLHATQPNILQQHTRYYMEHQEYGTTGRTSADQTNVGNQYPTVYTDHRGRNIILSGHHRAAAALLQGRPLRARHIIE